jgi:outer membrane receptor protein involved in Fe transport
VAHLQVGVSHQSRSVVADTSSFNPATQANFPTAILPGYTVAKTQLDLDQIAGKPVRLSFYVRNLTNEKYYVAGTDSYNAAGTTIRLLGAPRTYGVEMNYGF